MWKIIPRHINDMWTPVIGYTSVRIYGSENSTWIMLMFW
jgi:hypothetical protein